METQEKYAVAEPAKITMKEIDDYLYGSGTKLTGKQKAMFYQVASINGLNPFKREVYAIPYGDRFNIVTGYETYLKRAERPGKLAGWKAEVVDDGKDMKGVCTIWRKDWQEPLSIEAWLSEYDQHNTMWKNKPKTMIRKVAIAQAFRMAFPAELGGMPYTADEMPQGETITVEPIPEPMPEPDVDFPDPLPATPPRKQSAKVKKAIEWTLQQGMPVEDVEEAVGPLAEINEDMLPDLKAAYFAWKDSMRQPGEGE